jgi:16S rRNA (adenine(1408)-N(1))-methyltransferase
MEIMQGKKPRSIDAGEFAAIRGWYPRALIDLGTGDGRFVLSAARADPGLFAVGVDACRENLRDASRNTPANALFVIASAQSLPVELDGFADRLVINFPWGSLLDGLLSADAALLDGLRRVTQPSARVEARLNASALADAGWGLVEGGAQIYHALRQAGFRLRSPALLNASDLRACPTTWAKRMAFGRNPEAVLIR